MICHKLNSEIPHKELSFPIMSRNTLYTKEKIIQILNLENLH